MIWRMAWCAPRLLSLVAAVAIVAGCGGTRTTPPSTPTPTTPTPPATPPPTPPVPGEPPDAIPVNGSERIGWDQQDEGAPVAAYQFVAYVDSRPTSLPSLACSNTPGPSGYACSALLPPLTDGLHTIKIVASRRVNGELVVGTRSEGFVVTKGSAASQQPSVDGLNVDRAAPEKPADGRIRDQATPRREVRSTFEVTIVAAGLDAVSDLAALADGRVLIAESSGRVRVLADGLMTPASGTLRDVAAASGGLMSIVTHPRFAANHLLFLLYAADTSRGAVYRLARGREVGGTLGEMAVIADFAPAPSGGTGAIRFGADGKLYVALADLSDPGSGPSHPASLVGKVLRLNDDGTTPDDNPRSSPVISIGHLMVRGLAAAGDGRVFAAETAVTGRVNLVGRGTSGDARSGVVRDRPTSDLGVSARPAGLLVYAGRAFPQWRGHLLVARLDGGIDTIPVDGLALGRPVNIFGGEFGRLRSLAEGPGGLLYFGTANESTSPVGENRVVRLAPPRDGTAVKGHAAVQSSAALIR